MTPNHITLDDLTHQNIGLLKKLNTVIFPVSYSDKFYKESLSVGELAKLGNPPSPTTQLTTTKHIFGMSALERCDANMSRRAITPPTRVKGGYTS